MRKKEMMKRWGRRWEADGRVLYRKEKFCTYLFVLGICFSLSACNMKKTETEPLPSLSKQEKEIEEQLEIEDAGKDNPDDQSVCDEQDVPAVHGAAENEPDVGGRYHIADSEMVDNDTAKYGTLEEKHEEFQMQDGSVYYYYDMECFYFDDSFPEVLNKTLQSYYDAVEENYHQGRESYAGGLDEGQQAPYSSLIFQYFTYVGDDYVSLVYNDVAYMSGAHPYSRLHGITIDCHTGEIVSVDRFLDDSEEEIEKELQRVLDIEAPKLEEWGFYITEKSVVFFYYDPRFWDSVETERMR